MRKKLAQAGRKATQVERGDILMVRTLGNPMRTTTTYLTRHEQTSDKKAQPARLAKCVGKCLTFLRLARLL